MALAQHTAKLLSKTFSSMNTRTKGNIGEDLAAKHLKKHGYKIVERNYTCQFGEVDIVAKHQNYYVFLEVKSRKSTDFGLPRYAVNTRKQQTIIACAKWWLARNELMGVPVRFDVVEVVGEHVNVIQNAFSADYVHLAKK